VSLQFFCLDLDNKHCTLPKLAATITGYLNSSKQKQPTFSTQGGNEVDAENNHERLLGYDDDVIMTNASVHV